MTFPLNLKKRWKDDIATQEFLSNEFPEYGWTAQRGKASVRLQVKSGIQVYVDMFGYDIMQTDDQIRKAGQDMIAGLIEMLAREESDEDEV